MIHLPGAYSPRAPAQAVRVMQAELGDHVGVLGLQD